MIRRFKRSILGLGIWVELVDQLSIQRRYKSVVRSTHLDARQRG